MSMLYALVPLSVLGALAWAVVALVRRQGAEPLTLATAVAGYTHLLIAAGTIMAAIGVAAAVKAGLGYAGLGYSYWLPYPYAFAPTAPPAPTAGEQPGTPQPAARPPMPPAPPREIIEQERRRVERQRDMDLVRGLTLGGMGVIVAGIHLAVARLATRLRGGAPAWIAQGTLIILSVLSALIGVIAGAAGLYRWLSYALLEPGTTAQPFGEEIGLAAGFIPVWLVTMLWLLRAARRADREAAHQPASA